MKLLTGATSACSQKAVHPPTPEANEKRNAFEQVSGLAAPTLVRRVGTLSPSHPLGPSAVRKVACVRELVTAYRDGFAPAFDRLPYRDPIPAANVHRCTHAPRKAAGRCAGRLRVSRRATAPTRRSLRACEAGAHLVRAAIGNLFHGHVADLRLLDQLRVRDALVEDGREHAADRRGSVREPALSPLIHGSSRSAQGACRGSRAADAPDRRAACRWASAASSQSRADRRRARRE